MIYSHEVEKMCPVAQGVNHGAAPIPEEAKWGKSKRNQRHFRFNTRCGLVRSSAGCM